jgi:hypothetical protein
MRDTWRRMGGTGDPARAPMAEQRYRAWRLSEVTGGWSQFPGCQRKLGLR